VRYIGPQGLACACPGAQNVLVTITYLNGTVLEAIVLSREENEIRAIAADYDEVLALTRLHGTWISEDLEPVAVGFAWEYRPAAHSVSDSDCICSKELAAQLIQSLFCGSERSRTPSISPKPFIAVRPRELRVS
jgi:hypothetical protein